MAGRDKDLRRKSNECRSDSEGEKSGSCTVTQRGRERESVNRMAAVAAAFLAEQISWPEEKDKHRRGNHV